MRFTSAFFALSLLFFSTDAAILRTANEPHDHWAQLLRANRYSLVESPTWITSGEGDSSEELSTTVRNQNVSQDFSYSIRSGDEKEDPVVVGGGSTEGGQRNSKVIKGGGSRSKFECHVINEPGNVQVGPVISKTLSIIGSYWTSSVTVLMRVEFRDLGAPEILARGGGTYFVRMTDKFKTVLPVAAAESVRGQDLNGNESGNRRFDVLITINSRTPWYSGIDANPPKNRYDLVTVLLHEIYHNVLFAGSVSADKISGSTSEDLRQRASLYRDYRTRFDSFLITKAGCPVLGYLQQSQLASQLNRRPDELLADAVCNDQLHWGYNGRPIARLHSPRLFVKKSSVYHLHTANDPSERLMFPTVKVGDAIHTVGSIIIQMQTICLNSNVAGAASGQCRYTNPLAGAAVQVVPQPQVIHRPEAVPLGGVIVAGGGGRRIANLPVWAFALLIVFAILLALLLLALCLALLFRKRKKSPKTSITSIFSRTSKSGTGTRTGTSESGTRTSRSKTTYIPGRGGKTPKKSTTRTSAPTSSRRTTTSRPSTSSRKTSTHRSKHTEPSPSTERTSSKKGATCPSSGKSRYECCCKCCKTSKSSSVTPPPPVASVHTFDPDSVPATASTSHRKSCHKSRKTHKHSCEKSLKKTCKSKTTKVCKKKMVCTCRVCSPKSASSSKSSKCRKTMKCSCRACRITLASCSTSKPSSSRTSTCKSSSCKMSCSCKSKSSSKSSSKCPSRSSSKCSSKGSSSKAVPSTKPPSTKPPVVKPAPQPQCVPCQTCYVPCVPGTQCQQCRNVVEINVGWGC